MEELIINVNIDLLLKVVLAVIMLGVGLSLKIKDFHYLRNNKRLLIIGLLLKLILLPFLGFILLEFTSFSFLFKFGVILLLLSPGGTTTNVITYWLGGTTALTIFLTSLSGLICILTIPVFANLFSLYYFGKSSVFSLPLDETALSILMIIIVPSLIGLYIHERFDEYAKKIERIVKPVSVVLLAMVYLIKFFAPKSAGGVAITLSEIIQLSPFLITLNLLALVVGFYIPKLLQINQRDSMTISIEMGIQNAALAILIGSVFLSNQELVKPALIYAMFSFWTTLGFAISRRKKII